MRIHFINYADARYTAVQDRLNLGAAVSRQFDTIRGYRREWLETTDFYRDNKALLDMPRGAGYWAWKPFIILDALEKQDDGDLVVYQDCGDEFFTYDGLRDRLLEVAGSCDLVLTRGGDDHGLTYRNSDWTRRDCFVLMGCDTAVYWNAPQVEAGIIVAKKTAWPLGILREWLRFCIMPQVVSDAPNTCGLPNLPGFRDHRHDQSILTNLAVKHWLHTSREFGQLIAFNKYMP